MKRIFPMLLAIALAREGMAQDDKPALGKKLVGGKVMAVANDPFVFLLQDEGLKLDAKEWGIRAFFEQGAQGLPNANSGYEPGADIAVPPVPVPLAYVHLFGGKDAGDFLYLMAHGGAQVYASGAAVTDTGKIYFWGLAANDLLEVTSADGQRFTLHCDAKIFEGTQRLLDYPALGQQRAPKNNLDPPAAGDVEGFANCPAKIFHYAASYKVGRERVLAFLKNPKKADLKKVLLRADWFPRTTVGGVPPGEKASVTVTDPALLGLGGNAAACDAQGVIVTKKHEIYFWSWLDEHTLYLVKEGAGDCLLVR